MYVLNNILLTPKSGRQTCSIPQVIIHVNFLCLIQMKR